MYDYQFASVLIQYVMEILDGKTENVTIDLAIKDASGKQLA
ncbi:hypothetical protein [Flavobacterium sp.]|nr:hypothetical protein [Flavobacterium sp.]